MGFMDTLGGMASGAVTGTMISPGWGTLAGAGLGGLTGYIGGRGREKSANAQRNSTEAAMRQLRELSSMQYQQRMADLQKAMAFYGPAQNYLMGAYQAPTPALATGPRGAPSRSQALFGQPQGIPGLPGGPKFRGGGMG